MKKSFAFSSSLFCLSFLIGFSVSCKKPTEPTDTTPGFSISVEDVSCIEAWVRVKSQGMHLPVDIVITKNDAPALTFTMSTTDTVVMVDSLLPKQRYTLRAFQSDKTTAIATAECATMDTTSHAYSVQEFFFGDHGSSRFNAAAIVNENDIWVVGKIFMNDSLGNPNPTFYNLARWNGTRWKLERVYFINSKGQKFLAELTSIYVMSPNDIWLGADQIIRWDGTKYSFLEVPKFAFNNYIEDMIGVSNTNIYIVGRDGNIAHYDGYNWRKIPCNLPLLPSGKTVDFLSISGSRDLNTIWISGWELSYDMVAFLRLRSGEVNQLYYGKGGAPYNGEPIGEIGGVWTDSPHFVYAYNGMEILIQPNQSTLQLLKQTNKAKHWGGWGMTGQKKNDLLFYGPGDMVAHFNGYTVKIFTKTMSVHDIRSANMRGNLAVAVGFTFINTFYWRGTVKIFER